jgi:hypothetical protein
MKDKIYHYTKGIHILSIINDGIIKLSPTFEHYGEISCVSLTVNQFFEKGILPIMTEYKGKGEFPPVGKLNDFCNEERVTDIKKASELTQGFYRIEIDDSINLLNWYEYKARCSEMSNYNKKYFETTENILKSEEGLNNILLSLNPIPKSNWGEIEKFNVETEKWSIFTKEEVETFKKNFILPKFLEMNLIFPRNT